MDDCVLWPGYIKPDGYGQWRGTSAHRRFYEHHYGPIPVGMTVDHLCFTTACVNPRHLRLLTAVENAQGQRSATKTHCVNGHEFTEANTYQRPSRERGGRRDCRTCIRERARRYKSRGAA